MLRRIIVVLPIFFFSCTSNYTVYEKKGFAKVSNNNKIISTFAKGTLLRLTNVKTKNSTVVATNGKLKNSGSRIITLPIAVIEELNLKKNLPFIHLQTLRKNKIFIAKKAKTFDEEKKVSKKVALETIGVLSLKEKKIMNDKIYLIFGPFYYESFAKQIYKVLNKKINNSLIFKDYKVKNYTILIGPLNNLKEYDKIYLKLGKIGLIGFDIKVQ
ncbi:MAG: hypothetical protein EVA55_00145 [alpha proteobacterium HIMB114]|nr:MAG: hypothetical protein EVA55_00145 [alpha proteobacterium HIMB114]